MSDLKPNQIENSLAKLLELKDKLFLVKETLKTYKINSDRLKQLKVARKEMSEQIEEEKRRIEDEFLADKDFEQAKNDELNLKNDIKEKTSEFRELLAKVNPGQDLSTYDYNIKGAPTKVQVQRVVKVFINGKEEK
jgi:uncharacterized protein involved in exopolysaccharide biosynthesis